MTESFAQCLERLMLAKGLSQSALARKIWGSETDEDHSAAKNRALISEYLSGRIPDPENLQKLVVALECSVEDLMPDGRPVTRGRRALRREFQADIQGDLAHVQIDMTGPMRMALEFLEIVQKYQERP